MALRFYENVINNAVDTDPNTMYRDLEQAFVSQQWDNTSAKQCLLEQTAVGSSEYKSIEAWVTPTVADTTRGMTDAGDFLKIVFESIDHKTSRGLMYKFDNNYWLVHNYAPYNGLVQDCGIRRCNNMLKMIDPVNGAVFSIPCCVDYDMGASSVQVSRYIVTPNNHATVLCQGNKDTLRLFTTNTRFMLSGRPFKLYGYQNAVGRDLDDVEDTLLYLDLYLDEIRDGDNLITGIADNGEYNYTVNIATQGNLTLPNGSTGELKADVCLNGVEVDRNVEWTSSNKQVVRIDEDGEYTVVGTSGQATITCNVINNPTAKDSITITVGSAGADDYVVIDPVFDKVRQHQTITFTVKLYHNGELLSTGVTTNATISGSNMTITKNGNTYTITGSKIASTADTLTITAQCSSPVASATKAISVKAVSMMG